MERTVYDEDGQFLTGSFTDYALPRATDAVLFDIGSHPVPAKTPLGAKGCDEAGCAGSLPAVMNAVVDALIDEYGIRHIDARAAQTDIAAKRERLSTWGPLRGIIPRCRCAAADQQRLPKRPRN